MFLLVAAIGAGGARRRGQLLDGITLGMTIVVVLAVLSRLTPALFPHQTLQDAAPEFRPRLAYPFNYWNAVGSYVALTIVLVLHAACRADRSPRFRAVATALLPWLGLALYLTFSRGSVIAAAVAVGIVLWLSPRRFAAFGSLAIGVAAALPAVILAAVSRQLNDGVLSSGSERSEGLRLLAFLLVLTGSVYVIRLRVERSPLPRRAAAALAPHTRKLTIAAAVLVLAAAVVSAPKIADRISSFSDPVVFQGTVTTDRIETRLTSGSGNGRAQFWKSSWHAWEASPVGGRGAGTWEFWWRRHATINAPTRNSHSLFFDVLAELGTLGVLTLLGFVGAVLWACLAAARRATGPERAGLASIAGACVAWTIGAATDWTWQIPALTVVFFALAALAASALREQRAPAAEPPRVPALGLRALEFGVWTLVVVQGIAAVASWSILRSERALARNDDAGAESSALTATVVEPWLADGWSQLGLARVRKTPDESAIAPALRATRLEPTDYRTWLVLTRIEARSGHLGDATNHAHMVQVLAKGSPIVPTGQQLHDLATGTDTSLTGDGPK